MALMFQGPSGYLFRSFRTKRLALSLLRQHASGSLSAAPGLPYEEELPRVPSGERCCYTRVHQSSAASCLRD